MLLDELQVMLGVEALHDDGGPAHADGEVDRRLRRGMIERRRREVDHAVAVLPELLEEIEDRQLLHGWLLRQWPYDAFRPARGARRIEHGRAERFVDDRRCRKACGRFVETDDAAAVASTVEDQAELNGGSARPGGQ